MTSNLTFQVGNVAAGSWFSAFQSAGATGALGTVGTAAPLVLFGYQAYQYYKGTKDPSDADSKVPVETYAMYGYYAYCVYKMYQEAKGLLPPFPNDPSVHHVENAVSLPICSERLDVETLLRQVAVQHADDPEVKQRGIGVWVSGPTTLIHAVELAGAGHGGIFDVHAEEFEL